MYKKIVLIGLFLGVFFSLLVKGQNLSFSGGSQHSIMLCQNGTVYTMGNNGNGQLGVGATPGNSLSPIQVLRGAQAATFNDGTYLGSIRQVDAGSGATSLALACNGTVYSWGWNDEGQVGDNSTTNRNTPVQIATGLQADASGFLQNVVFISGGNKNGYAILSDGRLMAWGDNASGQLGDGTTVDKSTPVFVKINSTTNLTNVKQIDGGDAFGIALLNDGTVWAWGENNNRQLAQNNTTDLSYATQVFLDAGRTQPLTGIVSVTAGDTHVMALASDGTLYVWGGNWAGQLGYDSGGASVGLPVKVQVSAGGANLTGVYSISGGNNFSIVSMMDGTVKTWGGTGAGNYFGQTGTGSSSAYPVTVPGLTNIVGVSEGDLWSFAINSSGTVYAWGQNQKSSGGGTWAGGTLGLGSTNDTEPSPLAVTLPCAVNQLCPKANAGSDITLCQPTTATINAGSLMAGNVYVWKKDGVVIAGETSSSLLVNSAGTYRVIITNPTIITGCGGCTADSDQVVVTSLANTLPLNPSYCTLPSTLNFCVSGPSGSNYDWYSTATGGAKLNGAASNCYSASVTSLPTVYYAQDLSTYPYNTGYSVGASNLTGAASSYHTNDVVRQMFDVSTALTLNSVSIYIITIPGGCVGSFNVTLSLHQNKNATALQSTTIAVPCGSANTTQTFTPNWNIPVGTDYSLRITGGANVRTYGGGAVYPLGIPSIISLNGVESTTTTYCQTCYGGFFDWVITAPNSCARVAVQPVLNCTTPVDFISLNAKAYSGYNLLTWTTANEINNKLFYVQRSVDGINFVTIGEIGALANSNSFGMYNYQFMDEGGLSGVLYYRLIQVDYNGESTTSKIVPLTSSGLMSIRIWPNPSKENFNISTHNPNADEIIIRIISIEGKVIEEIKFVDSEKSIGNNLAPGVYFVTVQSQSEHTTFKIIKE